MSTAGGSGAAAPGLSHGAPANGDCSGAPAGCARVCWLWTSGVGLNVASVAPLSRDGASAACPCNRSEAPVATVPHRLGALSCRARRAARASVARFVRASETSGCGLAACALGSPGGLGGEGQAGSSSVRRRGVGGATSALASVAGRWSGLPMLLRRCLSFSSSRSMLLPFVRRGATAMPLRCNCPACARCLLPEIPSSVAGRGAGGMDTAAWTPRATRQVRVSG